MKVITNRWRLELKITKAATDVHDVAAGLHVPANVPQMPAGISYLGTSQQ